MSRLKALYLLDSPSRDLIYGPDEQNEIASLVDVYAPPQTRESVSAHPRILEPAEILLSGWGGPVLDAAFLAAAPHLKAVFYGAGSIKSMVTPEFFARNIPIATAASANAVPVAEYTLSQILFCGKRGWQHYLYCKQQRDFTHLDVPGNDGSVVGLVSLGLIARLLLEKLRGFDLKVLAYDPFISQEDARNMGVELCSLEDIFRRADIISLHTPLLPETVGMIRGEHFASMKPGAAFINTARGAVVREDEMIAVLKQRPDLLAVLDVVSPEPPPRESPLYDLSNVILTPHIAGSMGAECRRMGRLMVSELKRFLNGEELRFRVDPSRAHLIA